MAEFMPMVETVLILKYETEREQISIERFSSIWPYNASTIIYTVFDVNSANTTRA